MRRLVETGLVVAEQLKSGEPAIMEGGIDAKEFLSRNEPFLRTVPGVIDVAMMIETQALDLYLRMAQESRRSETREVLFADLSVIGGDVLSELPAERPPVVIGDGGTVRRPVARLGRNEPCRCGSGKKYKKCCYEKDQLRMRDASPYEGVTKSEFRDNPAARG